MPSYMIRKIDPELWQRLREKAVESNIGMKQAVLRALEAYTGYTVHTPPESPVQPLCPTCGDGMAFDVQLDAYHCVADGTVLTPDTGEVTTQENP